MTHYALTTNDTDPCDVYGIGSGDTPEDAAQAAVANTVEQSGDPNCSEWIRVLPCSEALYEAVAQYGGVGLEDIEDEEGTPHSWYEDSSGMARLCREGCESGTIVVVEDHSPQFADWEIVGASHRLGDGDEIIASFRAHDRQGTLTVYPATEELVDVFAAEGYGSPGWAFGVDGVAVWVRP